MTIDSTTKDWIRNVSDELAAKNGCRFDLERANQAKDWIETYCRLYEGDFAGQNIKLVDWQYEAIMRIFGWVKYSHDWKRVVRRFRKGSVWVPKKNKKSPTLAAIGLYLLCGDGELGQKVFSGAKDGGQAMIAHKHALEMVRQSPELMAECTINKATGRITHEPSRSFYSIVAGDNIRSQEGLNGSVLIDETHVVDRRLMAILKGAGISRSEPLQLEFSTAGNNPDGYGKEQFDRGALIEKGTIENEAYFYMAYGAKQDLTDKELENDLVNIGKNANPAWGHTIKESEFVADYNSSKDSISDLLDFKMYRLNIWQRSSNPWLNIAKWDACGSDFTEDDLIGQECFAAIDLASVSDIAAFALLFGPKPYKLLVKFWCPEVTAAKREAKDKVPYRDWASKGYITLTDGERTDYSVIENDILSYGKKFNIQEVMADRWNFEYLRQRLVNAGVPENKIFEFGQGYQSMSSPTKEFERCILGKEILHNNNPVLTWMAGNVVVEKDPADNYKPSKSRSPEKIDGIVTAIMALGAATHPSKTTSVYEKRGLFSWGIGEGE